MLRQYAGDPLLEALLLTGGLVRHVDEILQSGMRLHGICYMPRKAPVGMELGDPVTPEYKH